MVPVQADSSSFVIISRVGPQDNSADITGLSSRGPKDLPVPIQKFLKGQPTVLGYMISGALSVAASSKPTLGKMKSSMALNIVSCVCAAIAVIIYIVIILDIRYYRAHQAMCVCYELNSTCKGSFYPQTVITGMVAVLFILTIVELCVSLSTSIFACKGLCRTSFNEMTVVVYQTATMTTDHSSTAAGDMKPSQDG
ncbi:hypothetical protein XENTR_v10018990 [Xenopus tropicalis]|nr:hypothetical protein XENTR_v10018990 [Xenopus tropicalis]